MKGVRVEKGKKREKGERKRARRLGGMIAGRVDVKSRM